MLWTAVVPYLRDLWGTRTILSDVLGKTWGRAAQGDLIGKAGAYFRQRVRALTKIGDKPAIFSSDLYQIPHARR